MEPTIDEAKLQAFMGKMLGDISGTMALVMCYLGDRLGLFKDLAANGPATSAELAARAGVQERYAREWLGGMASAGYLEYVASTHRYRLPPEHAPALAQEGGPMFLGGMFQMFPPQLAHIDRLAEAFTAGGGIPQSAYGQEMWDGFERFSGTGFENLLTQHWLPGIPAAEEKLKAGAAVADLGCGRGRALIKLALTFPASRFVGYDAYAPTIDLARKRVAEAGVADRVRFEQLDFVKGIPDSYDVITTFDVVHDMVDPRGGLRSIHGALRPGGVYICLEPASSDRLEENTGPLATVMYGASLTYCMTTSLAGGGEALGTLGLPESKLREVCMEVGFSSVRRVPLEDPFHALYEVLP
jgi:SAM-dependent methyltransferase